MMIATDPAHVRAIRATAFAPIGLTASAYCRRIGGSGIAV
jgi:hypothetical protein